MSPVPEYKLPDMAHVHTHTAHTFTLHTHVLYAHGHHTHPV